MENAHFYIVTPPLGAPLPTITCLLSLNAHILYPEGPFLEAALHYPQPQLFDNDTHNPLSLVLNPYARNSTFPVNNALSITEQLAPAIAPLASGSPFRAVTLPIVRPAPRPAQSTLDCAALLQFPLAEDF